MQCDELGRFEYTAEEREEIAAKRKRVAQYVKERQGEREKLKLEKEYEEYFKQALDPQKTKEMHLKTFKRCGVPILEPGGKSFDDLMEEKMQRQGLTWKKAKRFKLANEDEDLSSKDILTANLAKFEELAKLNQSKGPNDSDTSASVEEDTNKSAQKRRSSMRMTLSSVEAESERCPNLGITYEKDEGSSSKPQTLESDSQIRWVDPREEEERKKLAARLACETQDVPTEEKNQQVKSEIFLPLI